MLVPRRQVKAYIHGHTHRRALAEHEGIHIVNTRAVGYVGRPLVDATGWVVARPEDDRVALSRYTIDPTHEETDRTFVLDWRLW